MALSEAAVRDRITRGTLCSERKNGTVYVLLEADESGGNCDESTDKSGGVSADESRLIEVLQDQVQHLHGELEAESEARRRVDHIIAALTERLPELEAPPQTPQGATESASEGEGREKRASEEPTEAHSLGERPRPWWRRIFGG